MARQFLSSGLPRGAATLMTGTALAHGIKIAATPVLTRLYGPAEFGVFAVFLAMLNLTSVAACLRFEMAISLPEEDQEIGWLLFALRDGRKILRDWRPDLIYASATPATSLLVARRLSRNHGIPWVAELCDLWVDSHYYRYFGWRHVLENRLERATLGTATAIVTVSEPLAKTLRGKQHYGRVAPLSNEARSGLSRDEQFAIAEDFLEQQRPHQE